MYDQIPDRTMLGRYLRELELARSLHDAGMERRVLGFLYELGWRPDATPAEVERVEQRAEAAAKPVDRPTARRSGLGPVPRG